MSPFWRWYGVEIETIKSDYYVASVVNAYRRAIDGKNDMKTLLDELEKTSHRRYTTGSSTLNYEQKQLLQKLDYFEVETYVNSVKALIRYFLSSILLHFCDII